MRSSHLERILGHLDDLDSVNLTILVQRLVRERGLLETVFNTIQEGILVIDDSGVIEYANQAAHGMLGIKDKDVGKAILWKLVPELARSLNLKLDSTKPASAVASREFELTYPDHRFVRLYIVPLDKEDKEDHKYALILSDITEDKLSTKEMIENEKISSLFMLAAGVAHELGNPLNSINIHLQLIKRQLDKLNLGDKNSKIIESLDVCSGEVKRLDGIIKHFLEAIKPTPPDLQPLNLLEVLESVLSFQKQELEDLNIKIEVAVDQNQPVVAADRNQIKQVFFNLIKNAVDAMGNGGEIKISTRNDGESMFMYFADTGGGIDTQDLAKVFQPYYSTKRSGGGLGMMIVQRIMRDHGATIGIDSQKDVGTVVTLQFPLKSKRFKMLQDD